MDLAERVAEIQRRIADAAREVGRDPGEITLEAATKTQTAETVQQAIAAGIRLCGENRVQELTQKLDAYAYDGAGVHFIGHLQTNKIGKVVGRVDLIESIDSIHLLEGVSEYAHKRERRQDILLEVNMAGETTKSGFPPEELEGAARYAAGLPGVRLRGIMCIPPVAVEPGANREIFRETFQLYVDIRRKIVDNNVDITCLSMGMSRDFEDAVREGSTLVRVGTGLFGPRNQ